MEAAENPFAPSLPRYSAAYAGIPATSLANPVFPDIAGETSLTYRLLYGRGQEGKDHLVMLDAAGFSFGYAWLEELYDDRTASFVPAGARYYHVSKGLFLRDTIGFGLGCDFIRGGRDRYDHYTGWTLGFLLRPARFLSLGYVLKDFNSPKAAGETVRRREVYALAIRPYPFMDNLTLSCDAERTAGEKFGDSRLLFMADLRLMNDISLFAGADKDRNFSFGIIMPFGMPTDRGGAMVLDYYGSAGRGARPMAFGITFTNMMYSSPLFPAKRHLILDVKGEINSLEAEPLFDEKRPCFFDLLNAVKSAGSDESIAGIILKIDTFSLGFSQVQELREEIRSFRMKGKKAHAILTAPGNKEYYLAASCDKIYFVPNSTFTLTGLVAEVYFFKRIMDKIGVKVESVKKGAYKSFNEPFTREHMSEEYRENLTSLLEDLNEQYLGDIARDRGIGRDRIEELFRRGFLTPAGAREAGYVDYLEYPEEAMNQVMGRFLSEIDLRDYIREKKRIGEWGPDPEIAVIHVLGSIVKGGSRGMGFFSEAIGEEDYRRMLQRAFGDPQVKAIIIRINSGGGSAVASDMMWHSLLVLKKKYPKPVVFSFGNMAASGGYYIACTGDRIFASPGTVTGSIGVVSGKLSLKRLYEILGIGKDVVKMSEFADIFSEARDMSKKERDLIQQGVDYVYQQFTEKVMESRGMGKEKIPGVAEGRIFSGKQGAKNGLVDNLGGLVASIEYAKGLARLKGRISIRQFPEKRAPLLDLLGVDPGEERLAGRLRPLLEHFDWMAFRDESTLYYFPFRIIIR